jgi:tripartite-type tricarboxylate transporter receptor subunit TctC
MRKAAAAIAVAVALQAGGAAQAQDAGAFYRNKTVQIVVGFSSGGGYDLYARLLSRHFGKHVPGSPSFVVQNMPGAGSLTAVRSLDVKFPQDGTVIVAFNPGLIIDSLVSADRTKFAFTDVAWLGSISKDFRVCYAWGELPIKTWEDLRARKEFIVGVTGPGSSSYINSATLKSVFGVNVKQVAGYPGSAETRLAIQRGELDGDCGTWSAITPEWREHKRINPFVRFSREATPDIPAEARFIGEFAQTSEQLDLVEFLISPNELGVPYIMSKQTPEYRLSALRAAFDETMRDKDFIAEAEKMTFPIVPVSGREAQDIVQRIYAVSPDLVSKAAEAIK